MNHQELFGEESRLVRDFLRGFDDSETVKQMMEYPIQLLRDARAWENGEYYG